MATVVHILDSRPGGSLVAHIKVGETYHQRKEVSEGDQGRDIPGDGHSGAPPRSLARSDMMVLTSVFLCISTGSYSPAVVSLQ